MLCLFSRLNAKSPFSVAAKEIEVDVIGFAAGFRGRFPLRSGLRGIARVNVRALMWTVLKTDFVLLLEVLLVGDFLRRERPDEFQKWGALGSGKVDADAGME